MSKGNSKRRFEAEQLDMFAAAQQKAFDTSVLDELRKRLRECQAKRLHVEAELAIVREERVQLAARLKQLSGGLYRLWKGESTYLDRIR